nr:hypothetical protein CFP56_11451 [Quercus suber]
MFKRQLMRNENYTYSTNVSAVYQVYDIAVEQMPKSSNEALECRLVADVVTAIRSTSISSLLQYCEHSCRQ